MKKLLCLLLALVMLLSLTACKADEKGPEDQNTTQKQEQNHPKDPTDPTESQPTDPVPEQVLPDELLGTWVVYVYMTEKNTGLPGFQSAAGLPIAFTFQADGTYVQVPYGPEIQAAIGELKQDLHDYMVAKMYATLEADGYTKEAADKAVQETYGMSIQAYAQGKVSEMDLDSLADEHGEGKCELKEDKLFLGGRDETLTIEIDGDTLTILASDDPANWEALFGKFPIELVRVEE